MQEYTVTISNADGTTNTVITVANGQRVSINAGLPSIEPLKQVQDSLRTLAVTGAQPTDFLNLLKTKLPQEILPSNEAMLKAMFQYLTTGTVDTSLVFEEIIPNIQAYAGDDKFKLINLVSNIVSVVPKAQHFLTSLTGVTRTLDEAKLQEVPEIASTTDAISVLNEESLKKDGLLKHFSKAQLEALPITISEVHVSGNAVKWKGSKGSKEVYHVSSYDDVGNYLAFDQSSDEIDTKSLSSAGGKDKVGYSFVLHLRRSRGEIDHRSTKDILGRSAFTKV